MTDRDELAALLLRAIQSSPEEPFTMPRSSPSSLREVCVDGWVDFVHVAEALIADGWARVPRTFKCLPGKATFTDKDGNTHELTIKHDIHLIDKHTRESTPTIDYTHTTDPRGWAGQ